MSVCGKILMVISLLLPVACSETEETTSPTRTLPRPALEDNRPLPNSDRTYFMYWNSFGEGKPSSESESLLWDLLDSGCDLTNVWFPSTPTPCEAMGAVTIVVVELRKSDPTIIDFGFVSDPMEWWIINTRVPSLRHYSFE